MLLRMSLSGGILIIMIAAVRFLAVNRLPKKYFMMLWGVALLRLKFVLAHEAVHVRRGDNLWKIVMMMAVCIHWFNPLVWIMYVLFTRDMELSCDEKVLSRFGERAKREYARALVGLAEKQYRFSLFAQGFGKSAIKERIEAIMKFKKATALSTARNQRQ